MTNIRALNQYENQLAFEMLGNMEFDPKSQAKVKGVKLELNETADDTVMLNGDNLDINAKAGKVEFRADKQGMIHVPIGKADFTLENLVSNFATLADAVLKAKPASAKGVYVKSIFLTTTMGPSIKLDNKTLAADVKDYLGV